MIIGECNCGAVSFEIITPVEDVYICHCSICRRNTGGSGVAVTIVGNENFKWITGTSNKNTWSKPNHDWEASFCVTCGSALPGKNSETNLYVPVSLLNNGVERLKVVHHIFVGSKANWEEIGDSGKQHISALAE